MSLTALISGRSSQVLMQRFYSFRRVTTSLPFGFQTSRKISNSVHGKAQLTTLKSLSDNPGAVKDRRRIGRGNGSGRGGTCGRGHKGQKSRSGTGKPRVGFEGGQTPMMKRVPKRGFKNIHGVEYAPLNVNRLQHWIDVGKLDPTRTITMKELLDSRIIHGVKDGVKLLGDGAAYLKTPISIEVSAASAQAIKAVEQVGGKVTSVYFNRLALRALLKPDRFTLLPRRAEPINTKVLEYYQSAEHRGYRAMGVQPTYPAPSASFAHNKNKQSIQLTLPTMAKVKTTQREVGKRSSGNAE